MVLSQTAVYALRAAIHLADRRDDPMLVRIDDMARELAVPRNYLSKILHVLAREGVLVSTRGPRGGFALEADPADLVLADVIRHFDDIAEASGCLLGRERCSDESPCAAHARWRGVWDDVRAFLNQTTLEDLMGSGQGVAHLSAVSRGGAI